MMITIIQKHKRIKIRKKDEKESNIEEKTKLETEYVTKSKIITLSIKKGDYHKMPYSLRIFARQTLQKWEDKDKLRISTQNAKNDLESYIFSLKEKLYEETVIEMSTEKEREVLSERVSEASQWLENEGESNILEEYKKQKTALENHAKDIFHRIKEATARPEAIINCLASINITKELLPAISEKHQVTPEEVLSLYKTCMEVEEWLKNKFEEQEKLEKFENPVLTSSMVEQKCSIISLQLKFFFSKKEL